MYATQQKKKEPVQTVYLFRVAVLPTSPFFLTFFDSDLLYLHYLQ